MEYVVSKVPEIDSSCCQCRKIHEALMGVVPQLVGQNDDVVM